MAQLKNSLVCGNLRVTDTIFADTLRIDTIKTRTEPDSSIFTQGEKGQVLTSDGKNTYWSNAGTLSGVVFNNEEVPVVDGMARITVDIPNAPGTLDTNNSTTQRVSSSEPLSNSIKLHRIAKTGMYSDLIGTPVVPTESTIAGWGFTKNKGTLTEVVYNGQSATVTDGVADIGNLMSELSDVAKTGSYTDLKDKPDIPSAAVTNPVMDGIANIGLSPNYAKADHVHPQDTNKQDKLVSGVNIKTINNKSLLGSGNIAIVSSGILNTTSSAALPVSASESLGGTVILHKIAKTGTYSDLIDAPSGMEFTSNKVTSLSSSNTHTQYPSAKCVYTAISAKADNSGVVHTTGNETIDGFKKFVKEVEVTSGIMVRSTGNVRGDGSVGFGWIQDDNGDSIQDSLDDREVLANKVTSISSSSTDTQYPSAKCMYDIIGDIETLINAL